jgi:hypothetical protein
MTNVVADHTAPFSNPFEQFQKGYAPHGRRAMGVEGEFFLTDRNNNLISPYLCEVLCDALRSHGFSAAQEFSGIVEICGAPVEKVHRYQEPVKLADYPVSSLRVDEITRQSREAYTVLSQHARAFGLTLHDTSHLATVTEEQAVQAMGQRPRALAGFTAMQRHAPRACRLLPLLNAGTQISLNVRDDDDLYADLKLLYPLTPMLYAVMANHPPQFEGRDCTQAHPRGQLYDGYGPQGGISQAFLKATCPRDLVAYHCEELVKAPLFFTYDANDNPVVPQDQLPTFSSLAPAQQTADHFRLAQSFNYHDLKICNIHDAAGHVVGKRIEVRPADAGFENLLALPALVGVAMRDATARTAVSDLLKDYGFKGEPMNYGPLLEQARRNAVYHNGRYMKVPFGRLASGKQGEMVIFARDYLAIIAARTVVEGPVLQEVLAPIQDRVARRESLAHTLAKRFA